MIPQVRRGLAHTPVPARNRSSETNLQPLLHCSLPPPRISKPRNVGASLNRWLLSAGALVRGVAGSCPWPGASYGSKSVTYSNFRNWYILQSPNRICFQLIVHNSLLHSI